MSQSIRVALVLTAVLYAAAPAFAQDGPLEAGGGMFWGSLGFPIDFGGRVHSSGVGVVNGRRSEIASNTWGERYVPALVFGFGGAYNVTSNSQLFATIGWEQAEADQTEVGLISGQPLEGKFSDYQGW